MQVTSAQVLFCYLALLGKLHVPSPSSPHSSIVQNRTIQCMKKNSLQLSVHWINGTVTCSVHPSLSTMTIIHSKTLFGKRACHNVKPVGKNSLPTMISVLSICPALTILPLKLYPVCKIPSLLLHFLFRMLLPALPHHTLSLLTSRHPPLSSQSWLMAPFLTLSKWVTSWMLLPSACFGTFPAFRAPPWEMVCFTSLSD